MAVYVWCELVCEYCSISICGQFSTGDRIPRKALKKEAAEGSAVFSGDEVFCCREHMEAHKCANNEG